MFPSKLAPRWVKKQPHQADHCLALPRHGRRASRKPLEWRGSRPPAWLKPLRLPIFLRSNPPQQPLLRLRHNPQQLEPVRKILSQKSQQQRPVVSRPKWRCSARLCRCPIGPRRGPLGPSLPWRLPRAANRRIASRWFRRVVRPIQRRLRPSVLGWLRRKSLRVSSRKHRSSPRRERSSRQRPLSRRRGYAKPPHWTQAILRLQTTRLWPPQVGRRASSLKVAGPTANVRTLHGFRPRPTHP